MARGGEGGTCSLWFPASQREREDQRGRNAKLWVRMRGTQNFSHSRLLLCSLFFSVGTGQGEKNDRKTTVTHQPVILHAWDLRDAMLFPWICMGQDQGQGGQDRGVGTRAKTPHQKSQISRPNLRRRGRDISIQKEPVSVAA